MISMKLVLIASLVLAFACVFIKLPSDQRGSKESSSPLVPNFDTVSFELKDRTVQTYNAFILDLRNELKGPDVKFGFPMMCNPGAITDANRFLLVKLSDSERGLETTLAVRVSDAYVVGYCCGKGNTAWFFTPDNPAEGKHNKLLFKDKSHEDLGCKGNYDSLGNREIQLGLLRMEASIAELGKKQKGKVTARNKNALLVLLQTVAEATRYQYISDKVAATVRDSSSFMPDEFVISYENNWGTLSRAVATAVGEGVFREEVVLKYNGDIIEIVGSFGQVRNKLSLLSFVKS